MLNVILVLRCVRVLGTMTLLRCGSFQPICLHSCEVKCGSWASDLFTGVCARVVVHVAVSL